MLWGSLDFVSILEKIWVSDLSTFYVTEDKITES